jgi:hypothetical protein
MGQVTYEGYTAHTRGLAHAHQFPRFPATVQISAQQLGLEASVIFFFGCMSEYNTPDAPEEDSIFQSFGAQVNPADWLANRVGSINLWVDHGEC